MVMRRTHARSARRAPRAAFHLAALAVIAALALLVVSQVAQLSPAAWGYTVSVAPGVHPATTAERAAALARQYLDDQTPELAAPELHRAPVVSSVAAVAARDAKTLEPRIPSRAVNAAPNRVVWIVSASGDFLNLHDLAWSTRGAPDPGGTIVIDDATGAVLGVFPHDPGT